MAWKMNYLLSFLLLKFSWKILVAFIFVFLEDIDCAIIVYSIIIFLFYLYRFESFILWILLWIIHQINCIEHWYFFTKLFVIYLYTFQSRIFFLFIFFRQILKFQILIFIFEIILGWETSQY